MNAPQHGRDQDYQSLLAGLQARSPAEVMGEAATSSLAGSVVTATLGWVGITLGVTALVYLLGGGPVGTPGTTAPAVASDQPTPEDQAPGEASANPTEPSDDENSGNQNSEATDVNPQDAAEAMGIDQATDADANADPLENRLNQLLDGLE